MKHIEAISGTIGCGDLVTCFAGGDEVDERSEKNHLTCKANEHTNS